MVVRKAARMAEHMDVPILGILENMSYARCPHCGESFALFGEGNAEEMAANFDTQVLGRIPIDPALTQACDAGEVETYEVKAFVNAVEQVKAQLDI